MTDAIYAFSGDPITKGHYNIVKRASELFDKVIVGIGSNPQKKNIHTFSLAERTDMAKKALSDITNAKVISFQGMLVDYAYENKIPVVIKGVRNAGDVDYEKVLHQVGESQDLGIETVILFADKNLEYVSSSNVKAIQTAQGDVQKYIHPFVKQCLEARISGQYIIGLTGEIAAGKSYIGRKIESLGAAHGMDIHNIELDYIGHDILQNLKEPEYQAVRDRITETFGERVKNPDGTINRKALGEIVFNNKDRLDKLNSIIHKPMMVRFRRSLLGKKGLFLVNAALIAESEWSYVCNNNTLFVDVDKPSQKRRMKERGLSDAQIATRLNTQYNSEQKISKLMSAIRKDNTGTLWKLNNSDTSDPLEVPKLFSRIISKTDLYGELRFRAMWNRLGADGTPDEEYQKLVASYNQSNRFYHDLRHIAFGLDAYEDAKQLMKEPEQALFAWFYHDYVMRQNSKVDEESSAEFAYHVCRQALLPEDFAGGVKKLIIEGTKHKEPAASNDAKILSDIDLLIFGMPEQLYDEYEADVWNEWSHIPREKFCKGRMAVLDKFLKKPSIYQTDLFHEKYEAQAQENLERAFRKLKNE